MIKKIAVKKIAKKTGNQLSKRKASNKQVIINVSGENFWVNNGDSEYLKDLHNALKQCRKISGISRWKNKNDFAIGSRSI
jgi:hypothetical protein